MSTTAEKLRATCAAVREVEADVQNVHRLLGLYDRAFLTDQQLLEVVQGTKPGRESIDGMTERLDAPRLLQLLEWPGTLALEVPNVADPEGVPQAFVLNHFADDAPSSIDRFRSFMLSEVFDEGAIVFDSTEVKEQTDKAFAAGNLLYYGEFVSLDRSVSTVALLVESYRRVVLQRLQVEVAGVLGKCLEGVRLGTLANTTGNLRIKRIASTIGLRRVGVQVEPRPLHLAQVLRRDDFGLVGNDPPVAELTFGLYLGDTRELRRRFVQRGYL